MIELDSSDLHIMAGEPPTMRTHGRLLRQTDIGILSTEDAMQLIREVTPERNWAEYQERMGSDFGFSYGNKARFRVSIFQQKWTPAMNMRLIPYKLLSFDQLGLPPSITNLLYTPRGLILITGPTGSGKTTTLATMIDFINANRDCHIITIEDPLEYYHEPKKSIVTQREVHNDVPTFAEGIVRALRQDPDVILVGEMRDLETISAAITAAETGHLVFATLHTTGAARTVDRIVDVFPTEQQEQIRTQLSGNLVAVISQLLLPTRDGKGRVAAYEIMYATPAVQHLIRERKTHSITTAIQTGQQLGMRSMDKSLIELCQRGLITEQLALIKAEHPDEVREKLQSAKVG